MPSTDILADKPLGFYYLDLLLKIIALFVTKDLYFTGILMHN